MSPDGSTAGERLLHPLSLGALAVLLLNDHLGKSSWPGAVTGKLSDLAGLVLFPILLQAALELMRGRPSPRASRELAAATLLTGLVFTLVKTVPACAEVYRVGVGMLQWPARAAVAVVAGADVPAPSPVRLTEDPTDLLALPALLLPVWLLVRRREIGSKPATGSAGLGSGLGRGR